jgi:hypothetical protein
MSPRKSSLSSLSLLCCVAALPACSDEDATGVVQQQRPAPDPSAPPSMAAAPAAEPALGEREPSAAGGPSSAGELDVAERFVLASITIDADGNRVSYAQLVDSFQALAGHFDNSRAVEAPGNAVFLTHGSDFFYGLAESPEWVRYSTTGGFRVTGRLSFVNFGITYMDFANVIVDDETAVSVLTAVSQAVVWNPKTMLVTGVIDLPHLVRPGYELEAFSTVAHDGLVYVPGKWVNWESGDVMQRVSMTILDPKALSIIGVAEDDRCGAGGRVTFDRQGYAYVMGDGRNQSMQVFAAARGEPIVHNCLLRIAPGQTSFQPDYYHEIPSLTGGLDSMTELLSASPGDGIGFSMMMYPDLIAAGLDRVNFEHWDEPAYKMWRIVLGDTPRAEVVQGANFSVVGFSPSAVAGKLYNPESADGSLSSVYEIDPERNTAVLKFTMDGYFAGLLPVRSEPQR